MKKVLSTLILIFSPIFLCFSQEAVRLDVGEGVLHGTLLLPQEIDQPPVVLFIAGSGPTDRDGNSASGVGSDATRYLAEDLLEYGIASLRYDKRRVAESAEGFPGEGIVIEDYVEDAKAFARMLAGDVRFSRVILAGHSEGSLVGTLAALENPDVDMVVSLAGAGRPLDVILLEQFNRDMPLPEAWQKQVEEIIRQIKTGGEVGKVPGPFQSIFREQVRPFLRSELAYDPAEMMSKLTLPVMIIQGGTDLQVKVVDAVRLAENNPSARMLIIDDMNHVFKKCSATQIAGQMESYSDRSMPNHPALAPAMAEFINSNR